MHFSTEDLYGAIYSIRNDEVDDLFSQAVGGFFMRGRVGWWDAGKQAERGEVAVLGGAENVRETSWWLDWSALPDLLWARLEVLADGTAEVLDLDGNRHRFPSKAEATNWLAEDEYGQLERLVEDGEVAADVELPKPVIEDRCEICRFSWASPVSIDPAVRSKAARLVRSLDYREAMRLLWEAACMAVFDQKSVALHMTRQPGHCHRCGKALPSNGTVVCVACRSLNYDW